MRPLAIFPVKQDLSNPVSGTNYKYCRVTVTLPKTVSKDRFLGRSADIR